MPKKQLPISDSLIIALKITHKNSKHLEYIENDVCIERGLDSVLDVSNTDVINECIKNEYFRRKNGKKH